MLQYITKENQDPQGLPKVYFCSHPGDQSVYSVQARRDQALACIRLGDLYRSLQMITDARQHHMTQAYRL